MTAAIDHALRPLVGLPLWAVGRAGSLEWFQFGASRIVPSFRGGSKEVGEYALHLDCPWQLVGPDGLAASDESEPESLAAVGRLPLVCEARFAGGWQLSVCAGGPDDLEYWRLFRPGTDDPHVVVGPAGVEE